MRRGSIRSRSAPSGEPVRLGPGLLLAVYGLWGALCAALFVTYARLGPDDLYHVSGTGLTGGASRVLVELNFPIALLMIAVLLIAMDALAARWWWLAGPAALCCAVAFVPGVVDDGDLDPRPINLVPAIGVAVAVCVAVAAWRTGRAVGVHDAFDRSRWLIGSAVAVVSWPWILADLGVFGPGWLFIMDRAVVGGDGLAHPAVHLGHHHGLDGALLVVSVLILSRVVVASRPLALASRGYLALLAAYGAVNMVQDGWHEQIVKRGLTEWTIPGALVPSLDVIWVVIVVLAVGVTWLLRLEPTSRVGARTAAP